MEFSNIHTLSATARARGSAQPPSPMMDGYDGNPSRSFPANREQWLLPVPASSAPRPVSAPAVLIKVTIGRPNFSACFMRRCGLPITLWMRLTEICLRLSCRFFPFESQALSPPPLPKRAHAANHGTIVTEISIPVQLNKIFKDSLGKTRQAHEFDRGPA